MEITVGIPLLNTKQYLIFNTLNYIINANEGGLFFINSPSSTKKIFLYNTVLT